MRMAWSGFPGDELAGAAPSCGSSPEVERSIGGLHLDHPVRLTHDRPGFFLPEILRDLRAHLVRHPEERLDGGWSRPSLERVSYCPGGWHENERGDHRHSREVAAPRAAGAVENVLPRLARLAGDQLVQEVIEIGIH